MERVLGSKEGCDKNEGFRLRLVTPRASRHENVYGLSVDVFVLRPLHGNPDNG